MHVPAYAMNLTVDEAMAMWMSCYRIYYRPKPLEAYNPFMPARAAPKPTTVVKPINAPKPKLTAKATPAPKLTLTAKATLVGGKAPKPITPEVALQEKEVDAADALKRLQRWPFDEGDSDSDDEMVSLKALYWPPRNQTETL